MLCFRPLSREPSRQPRAAARAVEAPLSVEAEASRHARAAVSFLFYRPRAERASARVCFSARALSRECEPVRELRRAAYALRRHACRACLPFLCAADVEPPSRYATLSRVVVTRAALVEPCSAVSKRRSRKLEPVKSKAKLRVQWSRSKQHTPTTQHPHTSSCISSHSCVRIVSVIIHRILPTRAFLERRGLASVRLLVEWVILLHPFSWITTTTTRVTDL
jgi:hypothetical protein